MANATETRHRRAYIVQAFDDLSFDLVTILANSPAMEAGHVLGTITASGKFTDHDDAHVDGSEVAAAVLDHAVPTSGSDQSAVACVRLAAVNRNELSWTDKAGDEASGIVDLVAQNIIVRDSVLD